MPRGTAGKPRFGGNPAKIWVTILDQISIIACVEEMTIKAEMIGKTKFYTGIVEHETPKCWPGSGVS